MGEEVKYRITRTRPQGSALRASIGFLIWYHFKVEIFG